jgi:hypothetical protein
MTIKIDSLDLTACSVTFINGSQEYVCVADKSYGGDIDSIPFMERYPNAKRVANAIGLDDYDGKFWLVCFDDCFDPPISIVRACDECEAIDKFIDSAVGNRLTDEEVSRIEFDEDDQRDHLDGCNVDCTGDGYWYYSDNLHMQRVNLVKVEV